METTRQSKGASRKQKNRNIILKRAGGYDEGKKENIMKEILQLVLGAVALIATINFCFVGYPILLAIRPSYFVSYTLSEHQTFAINMQSDLSASSLVMTPSEFAGGSIELSNTEPAIVKDYYNITGFKASSGDLVSSIFSGVPIFPGSDFRLFVNLTAEYKEQESFLLLSSQQDSFTAQLPYANNSYTFKNIPSGIYSLSIMRASTGSWTVGFNGVVPVAKYKSVDIEDTCRFSQPPSASCHWNRTSGAKYAILKTGGKEVEFQMSGYWTYPHQFLFWSFEAIIVLVSVLFMAWAKWMTDHQQQSKYSKLFEKEMITV